jgi:SSS family solute:Na+ symporter
MNFLHYAIFMFVVCTVVLVGVSLLYPAPDRKKLAGLTFATVDDKIDSSAVAAPHLARETRSEHAMNVVFTGVLLATVIGLWVYFR